MQDFLSGVVLVNAELVSFLVALWMTWGVLRLLFRLMPATTRAVPVVQAAGDGAPMRQQIAHRRAA